MIALFGGRNWLAALTVFAVASTALAGRTPVVLDADIGTDIDDTWALAQVLRSPELDLKLVLTETGDTRYRAALAAKFLEAAGRSDIPVGVGQDEGPMPEDRRNLAPWLAGYDLAKYPGRVQTDGVGALIELVMKSAEPVTIIAIGPVPNLALALQRDPRIAAKCRFVGMQGSFDVGYGGSAAPAAEYNVKDNPAALRAVLAAPWRDILLTPLDTCGTIELKGENYRRIWCAMGDPLLRAVIENYCIFAPRVNWMRCDFFATRSTTLFDCAAVYLACSEELVQTETISFQITDDGFTRRTPTGPIKARVAMHWRKPGAFEDYLARRLLTKP